MTVLVSHHPLVPRPAAGSISKGRLENQDLRAIGKCVDVVLAGHQTIAGPQDTRVAYRVLEKQSIVAQAGDRPRLLARRDALLQRRAHRRRSRLDRRAALAGKVVRGAGAEVVSPRSRGLGKDRGRPARLPVERRGRRRPGAELGSSGFRVVWRWAIGFSNVFTTEDHERRREGHGGPGAQVKQSSHFRFLYRLASRLSGPRISLPRALRG